ncbi:MAG TPA: hypothetical protein VK970_03315, partial [Candidatus Methylacidiphilales bacterium]|nr:hypothetical protein [Candidatus Methylacidiphilales bacterium]
RAASANGTFPSTAPLQDDRRETPVLTELRSGEWVAMFITSLPQGKHEITYHLRAETPGIFHALPCTVQGMYSPLLRANSTEQKIRIADPKR